MVNYGNAKASRVLERGSHQVRTYHRPAIIAYRHRSCGDHLSHLGKCLTLLPDGNCADHVHACRVRALRLSSAGRAVSEEFAVSLG